MQVFIVLCVVFLGVALAENSDDYSGCLKSAGVIVLGLSLVLLLVWGVSSGWNQFTAWRTEQKTQEAEEARIAEAKRRQETMDEKVRTFAQKEASKVWQVYQSLQGEIDVQSGKIEELRETLVAFDKVPEQDEDFNRICALRDEMIRSRQALRAKLEDAYIAAKKYEASPSRIDYQELHKKALEDGILEADQAEAKFKEMRLNK